MYVYMYVARGRVNVEIYFYYASVEKPNLFSTDNFRIQIADRKSCTKHRFRLSVYILYNVLRNIGGPITKYRANQLNYYRRLFRRLEGFDVFVME